MIVISKSAKIILVVRIFLSEGLEASFPSVQSAFMISKIYKFIFLLKVKISVSKFL